MTLHGRPPSCASTGAGAPEAAGSGAGVRLPSTRGPDAPVHDAMLPGTPCTCAHASAANATASRASGSTPSCEPCVVMGASRPCARSASCSMATRVTLCAPPPLTTRRSIGRGHTQRAMASATVSAVNHVSVESTSAGAGGGDGARDGSGHRARNWSKRALPKLSRPVERGGGCLKNGSSRRSDNASCTTRPCAANCPFRSQRSRP